MSQIETPFHREGSVWRALSNLTLACEVALDRTTNQAIARDRVGQRTREARELIDALRASDAERAE